MRKKVESILIKTSLVFFVLFVILLVLFFLTGWILPANGVYIRTEFSGHSMEPTLRADALALWDETPYDKLQVGDIIMFRKASSPPIHVTYIGADNRTEYQQSYADSGICHRIVDITDKGLMTRGDNNSLDDIYPVLKNGYIGKIIWHANGLGPVANWLFAKAGFAWFFFVPGVMMIVAVLMKSGDKKKEKQKDVPRE